MGHGMLLASVAALTSPVLLAKDRRSVPCPPQRGPWKGAVSACVQQHAVTA